jgi:hypothetical protein
LLADGCAAAVEATRRFFTGESPRLLRRLLPVLLAYFYRFPLLKYAPIATGPKTVYRPEATIFGYRHVVKVGPSWIAR